MSNCTISLKGLDFGCRDGIGGIKRLWLADWEEAAPHLTTTGSPRYDATVRTGELTDYNYTFKLYKIRTSNASMNSTMTVDDANGISYVTTELYFKITKLTEDGRDEVAEILRGNVAAIVETNQGDYYGLGIDHPLVISSGTANTGAALSDFSGYEITLTDYSKTLPYLLKESLIAELPQVTEE